MYKYLSILCVLSLFIISCAINVPLSDMVDTKTAIDEAKAKGICSCTNKALLEAENAYREAQELMEQAKLCSPNPIAKSVTDGAEQVKSITNTQFCSQIDLYEKIREKLLFAQAKVQEATKGISNKQTNCERLRSKVTDLVAEVDSIHKDIKKYNMESEYNILVDKLATIENYLNDCDINKINTLYNDALSYFNNIKTQLAEKNIKASHNKQTKNFIKYRVKKGDCLWNISKQQYLNPFMWPLIYWANKTQIKDPDLIYPNQIFKINKAYNKKDKEKAIYYSKNRGPWSLFDEK